MMDFFQLIRSLRPEKREPAAQPKAVKDNGTPAEPVKQALNNRTLLNELTGLFRNDLRENSLDEVVTFPMTFTVAMVQADFDRLKGYMPLIAQMAVKNFYRIIREEMGENRTCANMATYWAIYFIPCIPGVTEVNDSIIDITEGKALVFSSVNDTVESIAESEEGVNVSLTISGSEVYGNVNINKAMLTNLDVVSNNHFHINWDRNMSDEFKQPVALGYAGQPLRAAKAGQESGCIARLTCDFNGTFSEFDMTATECIISGSTDERTEDNIFKLPCKVIRPGHVTIQYIERSGRFMMAAYGKTTLNGNPVKQSSGGDVNWVELPEQANLTLNGMVMVKFRKEV